MSHGDRSTDSPDSADRLTGIRTLRSHGKKIDIDNNIVEEQTYASATDEWYTTKTLSSVITITIDGRQLI